MADFLLKKFGPQRLKIVYAALKALNLDSGAFSQLTREYMTNTFNPSVPDLPGINYYSYGASFTPSLWSSFRRSNLYLLDVEGPNDGLVSVESSVWGTYKGTLIGVNHLDLINWTNRLRWWAWTAMGGTRNFNAVAFYLDIAGQSTKLSARLRKLTDLYQTCLRKKIYKRDVSSSNQVLQAGENRLHLRHRKPKPDRPTRHQCLLPLQLGLKTELLVLDQRLHSTPDILRCLRPHLLETIRAMPPRLRRVKRHHTRLPRAHLPPTYQRLDRIRRSRQHFQHAPRDSLLRRQIEEVQKRRRVYDTHRCLTL